LPLDEDDEELDEELLERLEELQLTIPPLIKYVFMNAFLIIMYVSIFQ